MDYPDSGNDRGSDSDDEVDEYPEVDASALLGEEDGDALLGEDDDALLGGLDEGATKKRGTPSRIDVQTALGAFLAIAPEAARGERMSTPSDKIRPMLMKAPEISEDDFVAALTRMGVENSREVFAAVNAQEHLRFRVKIFLDAESDVPKKERKFPPKVIAGLLKVDAQTVRDQAREAAQGSQGLFPHIRLTPYVIRTPAGKARSPKKRTASRAASRISFFARESP